MAREVGRRKTPEGRIHDRLSGASRWKRSGRIRAASAPRREACCPWQDAGGCEKVGRNRAGRGGGRRSPAAGNRPPASTNARSGSNRGPTRGLQHQLASGQRRERRQKAKRKHQEGDGKCGEGFLHQGFLGQERSGRTFLLLSFQAGRALKPGMSAAPHCAGRRKRPTVDGGCGARECAHRPGGAPRRRNGRWQGPPSAFPTSRALRPGCGW